MSKVTRKEFLSISALLAGAAVLPKRALGWATTPNAGTTPLLAKGGGIVADMIVVNARVLTSDPAAPRAQAFAVREGRFLAVGTSADIRNLVGPNTRIVYAGGHTITPGFIDSHCHPSGVGELYSANANVRSKAVLLDNLRKRAALARSGATAQHNPWSNMTLGSGYQPVRPLLDAGVNVSMGTDGTCSTITANMLTVLGSAAALSKIRGDDYSKWLSAKEALSAATRGGAKAFGWDKRHATGDVETLPIGSTGRGRRPGATVDGERMEPAEPVEL